MLNKKYMPFKRIIDILISLSALIILSPLFIIIAIIIKLESKGPVFFRQKRFGKDRTFFEILKFRSMRSDTPDVPTHLLKDPKSFITKSGAFLRKTSLDELPQLINILKGEMSIIGPRPALWNQDDLMALRDEHGATCAVPGLTGLAQIKGRDELPLDVKAKLDGDYVNKMSLKTDIKIFFGTIVSVLSSKGVVEGKVETKEEVDEEDLNTAE